MGADVLLLADERMLAHDVSPRHPERPDRLRAILDTLEDDPVPGTRLEAPPLVDTDAVRRVHQDRYVDRVLSLDGQSAVLDPDTRVVPASLVAARLAAGAGVRAVDAVMTGEVQRAFSLGRPPGHHAEAGIAMGFCLFNNIAIAAAHAVAAHGLSRVLIVDWDVHHGNGTAHIFESRADVLVFNTHQYPLYPGTGRPDETGKGPGEGYTVNVPLPAGMNDGDYAAIYRELLRPVADWYRPELVLVSAGFDAHADDPLGEMRVTDAGFATLCGLVCGIADEHAGGRLVLMLEGGYDLRALAASVHACIGVLAGDDPPPPPGQTHAPVVTDIIRKVSGLHAALAG